MNLEKNKSYLGSVLGTALLGILIGILLILVNTAWLLKVIFVIMGIATVLYSIPGILLGASAFSTGYGKLVLILSVLGAVFGVWMIFWHSAILMILLGVYMVVSPLIEILLSKDKGAKFKSELPKLILGVSMLILGPAGTLDVLFDVAGVVTVLLSIVNATVLLIGMRKKQNKTGGRVFADTTGDGKIDTLYVDTTGDGKADTATDYFGDK